jgi:hypothetical protein
MRCDDKEQLYIFQTRFIVNYNYGVGRIGTKDRCGSQKAQPGLCDRRQVTLRDFDRDRISPLIIRREHKVRDASTRSGEAAGVIADEL